MRALCFRGWLIAYVPFTPFEHGCRDSIHLLESPENIDDTKASPKHNAHVKNPRLIKAAGKKLGYEHEQDAQDEAHAKGQWTGLLLHHPKMPHDFVTHPMTAA